MGACVLWDLRRVAGWVATPVPSLHEADVLRAALRQLLDHECHFFLLLHPLLPPLFSSLPFFCPVLARSWVLAEVAPMPLNWSHLVP